MTSKFATVLLLSIAIALGAVFFGLKSSPKIIVIPEIALIDEPVEISVTNLTPKARITIEAACKNKDNDAWKSHATFEVDDKGVVNVAAQAPIEGSYRGIDPMGLFWSMIPTDREILKKVPNTFNFNEVSLSVIVGDKVQAQKTIQRLAVAPNVEKRIIREQGLVGTLFYPKNMQHGPGIIVVAGSGGRIPEGLAQLFASHGYAAFALGYFGVEGLPERLKNIPLEYFQNAMQWFKKQPQVDSNRIAICGNSRGGELVLLLASTFPQEMQAVIAYTPSGIVAEGSWTYKNELIPGIQQPSDEEERQAAHKGLITAHKGTLENIRCPLLLISGDDDKVWPSTLFSRMVTERLDKKKSAIVRKHLQFPSAGHGVQNPYWPSSSFPYFHPRAKVWSTLGGTVEGNARANEQAWVGVLDFLKDNLAKPTSISAWQHSVNEIFAANKSGLFETKDKTGAPVILEWHVTNVHEPAYAHIMNSVTDLFIRAFGPVAMLFIKAYPDVVYIPNSPYRKLEPLFKVGIESVDWKAVEGELTALARSYWEKQVLGQEHAKKFANSIFIFLIVKEAVTEKPLGFVGYQIDDDDPEGAITLEPLAVVPEAQNRGIGKLLAASIFKLIPAITKIGLAVESPNEPAIKAYKVWGFEESPAQDPYHKFMEYRAEKSDILQKTAAALKDLKK